MLERFLHYNFSLFEGKKIILSCSGGMDSMVLLHLLQQIECNLIVYHVDHLSRNGQSTQDHNYVKQYCSNNSIEFYTDRYQHTSGNFQSRSRTFRYKHLKQLQEKTKSDFIVTAHHMGDNIETFFINALRGSGLKGLSGMDAFNPPLLRPLLHFRKKEIENYALSHLVPFVKDTSNDLNIYVRNIIRNEFLPRVEKLNPNIDERVLHTINKIRSDHNLLQELIHEIQIKYIHKEAGIIIIDLDVLRQYSEGKTFLYHMLQAYGVNIQQVEGISTASIGSSFDTHGYHINLDRGRIFIKPKGESTIPGLDIPSAGRFPINQDVQLVVELIESSLIQDTGNHLILSPTKVSFPLRLRPWMAGDRFRPSGMDGKSKKVSKFLKDLKIPNIKKPGIFVLISEDGNICGIPGYRADHRYIPDDGDKKVLLVQLIQG